MLKKFCRARHDHLIQTKGVFVQPIHLVVQCINKHHIDQVDYRWFRIFWLLFTALGPQSVLSSDGSLPSPLTPRTGFRRGALLRTSRTRFSVTPFLNLLDQWGAFRGRRWWKVSKYDRLLRNLADFLLCRVATNFSIRIMIFSCASLFAIFSTTTVLVATFIFTVSKTFRSFTFLTWLSKFREWHSWERFERLVWYEYPPNSSYFRPGTLRYYVLLVCSAYHTVSSRHPLSCCTPSTGHWAF